MRRRVGHCFCLRSAWRWALDNDRESHNIICWGFGMFLTGFRILLLRGNDLTIDCSFYIIQEPRMNMGMSCRIDFLSKLQLRSQRQFP